MNHSNFKQSIFTVGVILALAFMLAACGGDEEATPTTAPAATPIPTVAATATPVPTATSAPAQAASQPESPLNQPESPLAQPESPLATLATNSESDLLSDPNVIQQLVAETTAGKPAADKAAISGLLFSINWRTVIPGTSLYLTPALEDNGKLVPPSAYTGPHVELGDVIGLSDDVGVFKLTDVPPGNYYLAVWSPYDWLLAFAGPKEKVPLLITLEANKTADLGQLYVYWP
jgi:hypothetical protein